ncbi:membrane protein [Bartonella rattaustraliani]|uniref:membrane protein n=1 Tax=Bartonella rattaustraliani TaxID=481139 RepID=UPI0004767893|nr:membrane protein [Bartonella rattaustraliani]
MARKKIEKKTELTEAEKEMLQEMILTYKSMKIMSRFMRWIAFFIFLLILDFARFIDAIDDVFLHLKQWFAKH